MCCTPNEHDLLIRDCSSSNAWSPDETSVALLEEFAKDPEPIVSQSCEVALSMLEFEKSGKSFEVYNMHKSICFHQLAFIQNSALIRWNFVIAVPLYAKSCCWRSCIIIGIPIICIRIIYFRMISIFGIKNSVLDLDSKWNLQKNIEYLTASFV